MSTPPDKIADNEIGFYFENNRAVSPVHLAEFITAVDLSARLPENFGPLALIEVSEIRRGTYWIKFVIDAIELGANAISVYQFCDKLEGWLRTEEGAFARSCAAFMMNIDVPTIRMLVGSKLVLVQRAEMPAARWLEANSNGWKRPGAHDAARHIGGTRPATFDSTDVSFDNSGASAADSTSVTADSDRVVVDESAPIAGRRYIPEPDELFETRHGKIVPWAPDLDYGGRPMVDRIVALEDGYWWVDGEGVPVVKGTELLRNTGAEAAVWGRFLLNARHELAAFQVLQLENLEAG